MGASGISDLESDGEQIDHQKVRQSIHDERIALEYFDESDFGGGGGD